MGVCVSSIEFRNLTERQDPNQADRLFRAAITAFVSLTRPTRGDAVRLYDLAEPLIAQVSVDAQRFAAAALSDSAAAPAALIRLIANLPVGVSAPVIIRSPQLTEIDLIALIGRNGLTHARAIARRPNPGSRLVTLLASLRDEEIRAQVRAPSDSAGSPADAVRERLRAIALASSAPSTDGDNDRGAWRALRDTALTGAPALFQTALADLLAIRFAEATAIASSEPHLVMALRAIGLNAEQSFLILASQFRLRYADTASIRLFVAEYCELDPQECRHRIEAIIEAERKDAGRSPHRPANASDGPPGMLLRAS